jgi:hypothetical protein
MKSGDAGEAAVTTDEMAEIEREISAAVVAVVQAATRLAQTLMRMRAEELRRTAALGEHRARETRVRVRAAQQADAVVWRAVHRPQWWRQAGAEDIARVWRAASVWASVDPRADEARRIVVERLAERGVHIEVDDSARPEDAAWLSDALDRATTLDDVATGRAFDDLVEEATARVADADDPPAAAATAAPMAGTSTPAAAGPSIPVTAESVRAEAMARLARYAEQARQTQSTRFPTPQPDSPLWAAYERTITVSTAAIDAVREAQHVPYALRQQAEVVAGQMGVRLRQLADQVDPAGRGLTAEAAEQVRARRAARAARQADAARRQTEMAEHVRAAWPIARAERVIGSEAWPVLAYKLDQLDAAGQDVRALLRGVPGFVDRARTPAAFAYRVLDDATSEQAATERDTAAAARGDARDQHTIEADWRETATVPPAAGTVRAEDAHAAGSQDADWAASHEVYAAHLAAQGYPSATRDAVAVATTAATAASTSSMPVAARPRPAPQQPRRPGETRGR